MRLLLPKLRGGKVLANGTALAAANHIVVLELCHSRYDVIKGSPKDDVEPGNSGRSDEEGEEAYLPKMVDDAYAYAHHFSVSSILTSALSPHCHVRRRNESLG